SDRQPRNENRYCCQVWPLLSGVESLRGCHTLDEQGHCHGPSGFLYYRSASGRAATSQQRPVMAATGRVAAPVMNAVVPWSRSSRYERPAHMKPSGPMSVKYMEVKGIAVGALSP